VTNQKLKPCPFCGAVDPKIVDAGFKHWAVRCLNGYCKAQGLRDYRRENVIAAWNNRIP